MVVQAGATRGAVGIKPSTIVVDANGERPLIVVTP
jgi:hypothetical protein